jgi:hypothetical protein
MGVFSDNKSSFEAVGIRLSRAINELRSDTNQELSLLSVAIHEISQKLDFYDANASLTGTKENISTVLSEFADDKGNDAIEKHAPKALIEVARWMREAALHTGKASHEESTVISHAFRMLYERNEVENFGARDQFLFVLPFDVLTKKATANLGDLSKSEAAMEKKMSKWTSTFETWDAKVKEHEVTLGNMSARYNFVGLTQAFRDLYQSKSKDWELNFALCLALGIMLLVPFAAQTLAILGAIEWLKPLSVSKLEDLPKVLPIVGIELVLLYFFRVALHNFHSLKAQLLQLDLRMALCAFIEEYLKFAKGKSQSEGEINRLVKFENLIFSGLTPDPDKIPSTFDGLEHIANLAKEFRK